MIVRVHRLYSEQALEAGGSCKLSTRNEHYLLHVLRVEAGQQLRLFDGSGAEYHALVRAVSRKAIDIEICDSVDAQLLLPEPSMATTLAIGVSKGERMDWVIQKATELGISCIQPLQTQRVDVKLSADRWQKKRTHWQDTAISACEQCGRNVIPTIAEPVSLDNWLATDTSGRKFVLRAGFSPLAQLLNNCTAPDRASLLIGPEGGLSASEFDQALQSGFEAASLGPRILRTETAPVVALSLLQALWGDL